MKGRAGCLLLLLVLGALCVELWAVLSLARIRWVDDRFGAFGLVLGIVAISYIGVRIAIYQGKRIPLEFMSGGAGRRLVGALGGVLLAFPGYLSDALGILLLLPPIQLLLAKGANTLAMAMARHAMKGMAGGGKGFPGFPGGGFPGGGFPGGPFPGGPFPGMKPDDRRAFPRPTKTIDTTTEKD
jgi:UPF0716 family protein affecting phage T7 exclusion